MDNNMTAIVSLVMIGLGFANGMIVTNMLQTARIYKLQQVLDNAIESAFQKDQLIDTLNEELTIEKQRADQLLATLQCVMSTYERVPPPPGGPLKRSRACMEHDESDSESDEDFKCPTSPDVK